MFDRMTIFPLDPEQPAAGVPADDPASPRRALRRKLGILLFAGLAAFTAASWVMVRMEIGPLVDRGPAGTIRAHLDALNRGHLREAYGFFSLHYQSELPFEAFHRLVLTHRRMFHTTRLRIARQTDVGDRSVLEAEMSGADGRLYRVRFTMTRIEDQWWIDDVRWGRADRSDSATRT